METGVPERMRWWIDARFGMFIHWGLYSIPGCGEWVMYHEHIPNEEYAKLAEQFCPRHFNARDWASMARDAGTRYMVLTTRHHDVFCLFDSQASDFTAPKTAAGPDFIAEYAEACCGSAVRSARLVTTDQTLTIEQRGDRVWLSGLPEEAPDPYLNVVELLFDGEPRMHDPAYT